MTRALAAALVAAVALAATGCAGDDATRVTLTDSGCSYDGPESVGAGTVSLDIENETDRHGVFELLRLAPESSFEALQAHIETEQGRIAAGQLPLGPPDFATLVLQLEVDAGETGTLSSALTEATYAVTCGTFDPPTALHLAEPFEVS